MLFSCGIIKTNNKLEQICRIYKLRKDKFMKKFLSVLIALVMIVYTLPIVSATETENAQLRVKISGERMYIRTSHNETHDLVQAFRVNGDGLENGKPINEPFDVFDAGLVLKTEESYTTFDKKLSSGADEVSPFRFGSGSYPIGANHGHPQGVLVTAENHGKTSADVGSRWTFDGYYWNLLRVEDENTLLFLSDNAGSSDGKYAFWGLNQLGVGDTLTYVSHGENQDDINISKIKGGNDVLPAIKKLTFNIYGYVNGEKVLLTDGMDGFECDYIEVQERYYIMNPAMIAEGLRAERPDGGYTQQPSLAVGKPLVDYNVTYKILADGTLFYICDHEILDEVSLNNFAGHSYRPKTNAFGGNVKRYIPKVKPFTINGKYYDFTEPYNMTDDTDFLGGGEKDVTAELWENPNHMPDRSIEYYYDSDENLKASFTAGFLPILDNEPFTRLTKTSKAFYLYNTKKVYPRLIDSIAFKETGTKNQHIRAVSYKKYNDVTDEDISYYTVNYDADTYIYIDCHEVAKKDITFTELGIKGNSLEVVEKSDNVTYLKDTDSVNVNMPSGTYGYLVLKAENNAYVNIGNTAECKTQTSTTESNGDLVFGAGSSATYDIGTTIPSGTYVVKANALAAGDYTFSATVGDAASSDTKSGNNALVLGNFTFTNGQENTITISCTAGSNVTLDEIILEKISDIEVSRSGKTEFSMYNDASVAKSNFKEGSAVTVAQKYENGLDYNKSGSGYGVFDASGHYATYFVNVAENGLYDLSFITGRSDAEYIISVDDTKYIGSTDNANKASLGASDKNLEAYSDFVCGMYLTAGKHEIKVELKSGSAYLYAGILERVTEATKVDATKENTIPAVGKYNNAVYNDALEVYPDDGYATFRNGHKFYYLIDSAVKKDYTLYAITSGAQGLATVKDITNDKVLYTGTFGSASSGETKTKAGLVEIEKGTTLLEITSTGETANFYGFTLEPVSYKKVNSKTRTEFSFYKDALAGESNFGGGSNNTAAKAFEEGLEMDRTGSGYGVFNAAGHHASYKFDVEEAGFYDITAATGRSNITFNITIDDKTYTGTASNLSKPSLGTSSQHFEVYKSGLKTVYLEKGTHKITFERSSGTAYAYAWFFEKDLRKVDADDETLIFAVTNNCDATYNGSYEVYPNGSSSISGDFADYKDEGWVTFRKGHKFRYEIKTNRAGYYALSPILGGASATTAKITNYATGEVLYNGAFGAATSGYYAALKNSRGTIYLDEGITAIEIESTGNTQYFYGFALKCVDPEITMTNASGNAITEVTDGTMNVSVNLGKIPYDDVYFAIYETKNGKTVLYKLAKAEVTSGVATATISKISKKSDSTYSAKVFSWDAESLKGYSYSTQQ